MGRLRRGGTALCAAFVLLATGLVSIGTASVQSASGPATATKSSRVSDAPVVVPDRYLIQVDASARARAARAVALTGATVNLTYDSEWSGLSVTATEAQLKQIRSVPGVSEVFPVYLLQLSDPDASSGSTPASTEPTSDDSPSASASSTAAGSGQDGASEVGAGSQARVAEAVDPPTAGDDSFDAAYLTPTTLDVLANDSAGGGELQADSVVLTGDGVDQDGRHLEVAGRGTFTVGVDGTLTFVSAPGWTGTLEPVSYRVSDTAGATATATVRVTVTRPAAPHADDDTVQLSAGRSATVDVLANDGAGGAATLQADSLCLRSTETCSAGLTTADGTWSVTSGRIGFTPADGFTGSTVATYRVADELGQTAEASVTAVVHPAPQALDHTSSTPYLTPVTVPVLDDPQVSGAPDPDPTSVRLRGAGDELVTSLDVSGEGSYEVTSDGGIRFTPVRGFTGQATPVQFEYSDVVGGTASARLLVTVQVPDPPVAVDDAGATTSGTLTTVAVLANDEVHGGSLLQASTLCLQAGPDCVSTTSDASGLWETTVDGRIAFTPAASFIGTAQRSYTVADELGRATSATLAVTVVAGPHAVADSGHTPYRRPVTVDVLVNDTPGSGTDGAGTLDPASVKLVANGGTELSTAAGTYQVSAATGAITFAPAEHFQGLALTDYEVTDSFGNTAVATLSVMVGAAPVAVADTATTKQATGIALSPLANDVPGDDGGSPASTVALVPASLVFTDGTGRTLSTAQGTWTALADGSVTFAPNRTFSGTATARYRVGDAIGNTAEATISVEVTPVTPRATDDTGHAPAKHPVENIAVLDNDSAGDASAPLVPGTVALTGSGTSDDGSSRTTDDGTWTLHTDHTVSFVPSASFHGETATGYHVADANGTLAAARVIVQIGAPTTARDLQEATSQNITLAIDPAAAITLGDDGAGTKATVVGLRLTAGIGAGQRLQIVDGQGVWQVGDDNLISFDPETAFTGPTTPVEFEVTDSFGNTATARITVTVSPITPRTADDTAATPANRPVTVPVLANDAPGTDIHGNSGAALEYSRVSLVVSASITASSLVTDRGTWTISSTGIVFAPRTGVVGPSSVQYRVLDHNGTPGFGTLKVNVGALPQAVADTPDTPQDGRTLSVDPTANDVAGDDGTGARFGFRAGSLVLTDPAATAGGKSLDAGQYTWTVDATNKISFTANWKFSGTASTPYRVTDSFGNSTTSTITVDVTQTPVTSTEQRLNAIGALQSSEDGAGIKVGIIDSGIDYDHPDLGGAVGAIFPTTRVSLGKDYVDNDNDPMDCFGHGTHVAGIIGANGNPKQGGAYGVAPDVTFGAYRVFNCDGKGTTDKVLAAMIQAGKDGMNVVNLSLGATSVSWPNETGAAYPLTQEAANLVKQGVVVVAAAGNSSEGLFTVGSPAVGPGVISVAAADASGTAVEGYSAMGLAADLSLSPTLTTPGSSVYSTWAATGRTCPDDTYSYDYCDDTGTSMAAPQVAGAAAAILQAKRWTLASGTPARVAALLYGTATPLASTAPALAGKPDAVFRQGAGLLQLESALTAPVTASPSTLKLGEGTTETKTVTLTNSGTAPVTYKVTAVTGTSAAASTGSRTDVGNKTPDWAYGVVGFKASPSSVTVAAGKTASVKVTITAPAKILAGKQGMLYGGWVTFTPASGQTVSVPFAGLRGDYQKVKVLTSGERSFGDTSSSTAYTLKLPGLAYRAANGMLTLTTSGTRTFVLNKQDLAKGDLPYVMFHLDYPTSGIRLKAINQKTKKTYYALLSGTSSQLAKRGRDEGYSTVSFYGAYSRGFVPAGTYKLQLRVLKPLSSSSWETYTTRAFKLSWK